MFRAKRVSALIQAKTSFAELLLWHNRLNNLLHTDTILPKYFLHSALKTTFVIATTTVLDNFQTARSRTFLAV